MATTEPPDVPSVPKAVSDVMVGVRTGDPEREAKGRHDLVTAKVREAINREVARFGPLTPDQIRVISGLLSDSAAEPVKPSARQRKQQS